MIETLPRPVITTMEQYLRIEVSTDIVKDGGERTIIILVDQGDPILHERAEYADEWGMRSLVGEVL